MKKWISTLVVIAFVMATTMPSYSRAMPTDHSPKAETSEHADCHKMAGAHADKATTHEKQGAGKDCCKKGMCKCANGSCHASVKVFGNGSATLYTPLSQEAIFGFAEQHLSSAFLEGIKRPPRA